MLDLSAQSFFSLEEYSHGALFQEGKEVWDALAQLSDYLKKQPLGKIEIEIPSSVFLANAEMISIAKGVVIEPGVYIQGPCIIGPNCKIRQGAYIRENVITGNGCVIGHGSEIKHSILLNRACVAHFNYVGDSILGNGVNLGAGVKIANLRLDHSPVTVSVKGKKIQTHLKKLGAIVGDGAQIGCNTVTNPGTLLGKNSICYPCLNVGGYVPDNGKVKSCHTNVIEE